MKSMTIPSKVACELITWERSAQLSRTLAKKVIESGYSPDLVIAIARGGFVPARIVCDHLLLNDLTSIKVEHWGIATRKSEKARIKYPLSMDISGKKVLVVDDVTDTGETMALILDYLRSLSPLETRIGVLHHKACSQFVPDYIAEVQPEWRWIVYPWAIYEDLAGFSSKIISEGALDRKDLESALFDRYCMRVGREVLEDVIALLIMIGEVKEENGLLLHSHSLSIR
ncbi:MAG: phosphoribosyltransferase [Methanomicrobiales archaeon]|nr:phosphoribosyltransferase [Methanomicrobiales archaeon]